MAGGVDLSQGTGLVTVDIGGGLDLIAGVARGFQAWGRSWLARNIVGN